MSGSIGHAADLINEWSPHFVVSFVGSNAEEEALWKEVDVPFFGDGMTRWVDGQYALGKPELGLSNWESGRLLGRSGVLSGDSVFTVRMRMSQSEIGLSR
jgi:glutamate-5-semialdehyde dehydrogenase